MTWRRRFATLLARELRGAARNRSYLVLALAMAAVVFWSVISGGGPEAGYVPTVVDLLVPVEVLVPAIGFATGYRAVVDDAQRGELTVLETYPVPAWMYVGTVYLGRLAVVLGVVLVPLGLVGVYVAVTAAPDTTVFATHGGIDSPALFVRFLALTGALAVALAASAFAASRRRAIVLGLVGLVVVVGADLALLRSLSSGVVGERSLDVVLGASPMSAYRGLVFETVVSVAFDGGSGYVAPGAAVTGLLAWTVGSQLRGSHDGRNRRGDGSGPVRPVETGVDESLETVDQPVGERRRRLREKSTRLFGTARTEQDASVVAVRFLEEASVDKCRRVPGHRAPCESQAFGQHRRREFLRLEERRHHLPGGFATVQRQGASLPGIVGVGLEVVCSAPEGLALDRLIPTQAAKMVLCLSGRDVEIPLERVEMNAGVRADVLPDSLARTGHRRSVRNGKLNDPRSLPEGRNGDGRRTSRSGRGSVVATTRGRGGQGGRPRDQYAAPRTTNAIRASEVCSTMWWTGIGT